MKVRYFLIGAVGAVGIAASIHYSSLDGIHGAVLARVLGDDTKYAAGYTSRAFREIRAGMTESQVRELLGAPLGETWRYETAGSCDVVYVRAADVDPIVAPGCREKGITPHMPVANVLKILGPSPRVTWSYTESPRSRNYRERVVFFEDGRVLRVMAELYLD